MKLILIRHAESYSNTQGRIMSTTDLPLTEKGTKQLEEEIELEIEEKENILRKECNSN